VVNKFVQPTSTLRPLSVSFNTFAAAKFDGVDDAMSSSSLLSDIIQADAYHAFFVLKFSALNGASPNPYENMTILGDVGPMFGLVASQSGVSAYHWDGSTRLTPPILPQLNQNLLVESSFDGALIRCTLNGGGASSISAGNVLTLTSSLGLGKAYPPGLPFAGTIASIVLFNQVLSPEIRTNVRAYLSSKYGVPS
jgi:hypothetical protein